MYGSVSVHGVSIGGHFIPGSMTYLHGILQVSSIPHTRKICFMLRFFVINSTDFAVLLPTHVLPESHDVT